MPRCKDVGGGGGGSVFQEEEMSGPNSLKQKQIWPTLNRQKVTVAKALLGRME